MDAHTIGRIERLQIPLVIIDPVGAVTRAISTVSANNWIGGIEATRHLLDLGHRRIGIITGPEDILCSQERLEGYTSALGREGIAVDPALVARRNFEIAGGRRAGAALLDLADPPTAIFAGSDLHAFGVYQEALERGLRIPDDVSVIGFDDADLCEFVVPPLTTVRQPIAEMAAVAVRQIDAMRGSRKTPPTHTKLNTYLKIRESTQRIEAPISGGNRGFSRPSPLNMTISARSR
ncbi:MAG: substrate-binding domain-containing protein [Microbacterium sp.]